MNFTCKYCGHPCLTFILKEQAHICHNCSTKLQEGIKLEVDLFWDEQREKDYFNFLDMVFDS